VVAFVVVRFVLHLLYPQERSPVLSEYVVGWVPLGPIHDLDILDKDKNILTLLGFVPQIIQPLAWSFIHSFIMHSVNPYKVSTTTRI